MTEGSIYLSYHNRDFDFAQRLAGDLIAVGIDIWFDRLCVSPQETWTIALREAIRTASTAIVIASKYYARTAYCQQELTQLRNQNATLIFIWLYKPDDPSLSGPDASNMNIQMDNWQDADLYQSAFDMLHGLLKRIQPTPIYLTDEAIYLLRCIAALEAHALKTLSAMIQSRTDSADVVNGVAVRPRAHEPMIWLEQGEYRLQERIYDESANGIAEAVEAADGIALELAIENMLEWIFMRPQVVLIGEAGVGKSSILAAVALFAAHQRVRKQRDHQYPLPLLIDLVDWPQNQALDDFVRGHWTLDSDVFELLKRGDVMLFVDGVDEVMGDTVVRGAAFSTWLATHDFPAIALTCRSDIAIQNLRDVLPMIRVRHLTATQVGSLTQLVLDSAQGDAFLQSIPTLITAGLTAEMLALRLLLWRMYGGDDTPASDAFVLENAIRALYELSDDATVEQYSVQDVVHGLERLAFRMTEQASDVYVPRAFVLEALGDDLLIQVAVHLGILETHGEVLRFAIPALQSYLSARALLNEGIYTRLSYPEFDAEGNRKPTRWDATVLRATGLLTEQVMLQTIDTIADVDPFFAYQCVTYHGVTAADVLDNVLWKVLDTRYQSGFQATRAVVDNLNTLVTFANHLISALRDGDSAIVRTALRIIDDLNMPLPDGLVETIKSLDFDFLDAVYDTLEQYPFEDLVLGLLRLVGHSDPDLRANAVFLLGELGEPSAVPVLTRLKAGSEDACVLEQTAEALGKIPLAQPAEALAAQGAEQSGLAYLFSLLSHENAGVVNKATWALNQHGRAITATAIRHLNAAGLMSDSVWHHMIHADEVDVRETLKRFLEVNDDEVSGNITASQAADNKADEGETDRMRKLLDILAEKMAVLRNRESFDAFTNDVMDAMGVLPPATSPEQSPKQAARKEDVKRLEARIRNTQATPVVPQAIAANLPSAVDAEELPDRLIVALENGDWIIRQRAVREIAAYPPRVILSVLLDAVHDPDGQVKVAVIESLPDEMEFPVVLNALIDALNDDDYMVVDAAADRLRPRAGAISQRLLEGLGSASEQALVAFIGLLGCTGDAKVVPHLVKFLPDERRAWMEDKTLGEHAAQALLTIGTPEAIAAVRGSGHVEERAMRTILPPGLEENEPETVSAENTMRQLVATLESDEWGQSQKAAQQIRETARRLRGKPNDGATQILVAALNSETWEIRWTAAEALAWLQNDAAAKPLINLLKDDHWIVKIAVIRALIELDAREGVSEIARLLYDGNNAVREAAAEGLGVLGTGSVLPALEVAMKDDDQFVRLAAVRAITGIKDPGAQKLLVSALQDTYSHVRWTAMRRLGEDADKALLKVIAVHLRDKGKPEWESITVGELAERAIEGMNTPQSKQVLKKWSEIKNKR